MSRKHFLLAVIGIITATQLTSIPCYAATPKSSYKKSYTSTNKSSSTKKSSSCKKTYFDTYDDGYNDVYDNGDYDDDRYRNDWDYALGVDDALDDWDDFGDNW